MIIEAMIIGVTVCFVGSLLFINSQVKGLKKHNVDLSPFIRIEEGTPCPKCLRPAKNEVIRDGWVIKRSEGLRVPVTCSNSSCKAKEVMHLHCYCNTCSASWFMETADVTALKNKN